MITKKLILSGRVQGVGMRFFVNRQATRMGVTGYVKNLRDGTVEAVIQGEQELLDNFVGYLRQNSPGYLDHVLISELNDSEVYSKFSVKLI